MRNNFSNQRGFTLIELVVVISIIGMLSAVTIFAINPIQQIEKSRDNRRKADLEEIRTNLEFYRSDQNTYPDSTELICGESLAVGSIVYMESLPCDPLEDEGWEYGYKSDDGVVYTLYACLENEHDVDRDEDAQPACSVTSGVSYTLTNP